MKENKNIHKNVKTKSRKEKYNAGITIVSALLYLVLFLAILYLSIKIVVELFNINKSNFKSEKTYTSIVDDVMAQGEEDIKPASDLFKWKIDGDEAIVVDFSDSGLKKYYDRQITEITSNEIPSKCSIDGREYIKVRIGESCFNGKDKIQKVELDGIVIESLAFANCTGLKEVVLKNCSFEQYEGYQTGAFYNCVNVEKIEAASCNNWTHFYGCNNIKEIHFNVSKDDNSMYKYNGSTNIKHDTYKFTPWYNARNEFTLIFDDGIKNLETSGFVKTTKVKKLVIPIEFDITHFYFCRDNLTEVVFTKGITGEGFDYWNLSNRIPWYDYDSGKELNITLSEGIKSIGKLQFEQLANPKVHIENLLPSTLETLGKGSFNNTDGTLEASTLTQGIILPDGIKNIYARVFNRTKVEYIQYKGVKYTNKKELIDVLVKNGVTLYSLNEQPVNQDNDAFNIQGFKDVNFVK